jgi:hypothetical protein
MKVNQIYELMNGVTSEILGKTDLVKEDLSNIVDVGVELFDNTAVDNYVKSLVNHIGKVIFVNRPYSGNVPSVLMDSWEFGSVLEKISADIPQASENQSWELEDGKTYNQDVFYKPSVSAKFFNSKVTFEVPMSFTELQVKDSFSNASQLNGFLSMLYNAVDKSMSIKIDSLIMRTIANAIGETVNADFKGVSDYSTVTSNKAVNLLKLYNEKFGTKLTAQQAVTTPEFIRYASFIMSLYTDRLSKISTLFNVGGKERFTSSDRLHTVMLSEFKASATAYLQSDTYHDNYVALPNAESVPYWQASGKDYSFDNTSKITVKTSSGAEIELSGILAVMFDSDCLGVCNTDRRVTTNYNAKAEFYNNYYKFDASYFNDLNENFVVFYVA